MKSELNFAFDRSMRTTDADGRLHVESSHISKAMICPYYGKEIPGYEQLGLDPNKIYRLFRDPVELERGAETFARLPILREHIPVTVDSPRPDLVIGSIGSDIVFKKPYLDADLCFWDIGAITAIDTGDIQELSCAYRYVPVMEPGEYEGEHYDGVMTQIRGNHLALVEAGRAGSDVVVADSNPFTFEVKTMKMTKTGKALYATLCAVSPVLAADAGLAALVGSANRKDFKKDEVKGKLIAMDAKLNPETLDIVMDAVLDTEKEPKAKVAEDESEEEKKEREAKEKKIAEDEAEEEKKKKEEEDKKKKLAEDEEKEEKDEKKVKAAMDSLRSDLKAAAEAARDVRASVGDVIGMDSAAEIYAFALDQMKVDHEGVKDAAALRALYKVAVKVSGQAPAIAQDAGGLDAKFPAAARFRHA